jgi:cysteine desulfuration protein SufE
MSSLADVRDEYAFLDPDDRYRLLIDLGRALEPMPAALKTDAITPGLVALVLLAVQDRTPAEILATDVEAELEPFDLKRQLSSNRTQGLPNMIALVRDTAGRLA